MSKRAVLVLCLVLVSLVVVATYLRQRTYNRYSGGEVSAIDPRESTTSALAAPVTERPSHKESAGHPADGPASVPAPAQRSSTTGNDGLSPTPQSGAALTGSGRFQVYRQGDLTWRVDTENGATCVLFATDEEWQNPRVYRRACDRT